MSAGVGRTFVIGIGGGSGAGKTFLAERIVAGLRSECAVLIAQDAYYRDRSELRPAMRSGLNFDHPDALDLDLFAAHLRALRASEAVPRLVYDFTEHVRRSGDGLIAPLPVVVVEGLHPWVREELRALYDVKLYIEFDAELRLLRRVRRDVAERGRTAESVLRQYEATVRPMYEQFVAPQRRYADWIVSGAGDPGPVVRALSALATAHEAEK